MRRIFACLLMISLSAVVSAQDCPADESGTIPTAGGNKGLPDRTFCFDCRELTEFPGDFANSAWNYVAHGDGRFTYNYYYSTGGGRTGALSTMPITQCNALGQCATVMFNTNFNTVGIDLEYITINLRTSVINYEMNVQLPNGEPYDATLYPQLTSQEPLPVPQDSGVDNHEPGDCLSNDGTARDPDPIDDGDSGNTGAGGGNGGGSGGGSGTGGTWVMHVTLVGGAKCRPDFSGSGSGVICKRT